MAEGLIINQLFCRSAMFHLPEFNPIFLLYLMFKAIICHRLTVMHRLTN